ncbi:MAG: hypothetical protein OEZ43_10325 [Gammaproteobacteria bacterium]|nr:hypothetical protein [Gammaproteobacteria bacterium]
MRIGAYFSSFIEFTITYYRHSLLFCTLFAIFTLPCIASDKNKRLLLVYDNNALYAKSLEFFEQNGTFKGFEVYKIYYDNFSPSLYKLDSETRILTIGTDATLKVASLSSADSNILALFVTRSTYGFVKKKYPNLYLDAITLDQPIERVVDFAIRSLNSPGELGFLLGPSSIHLRQAIEAVLEQKNVKAYFSVIKDESNSAQELKKFLVQKVPVVAIPDSVAYSPRNAKWLLYMAYQQRVPVVGFSPAFIRAGAISAIYSTPEQILLQAADIFTNNIRLSSDKQGQSYDPKEFSVEYNDAIYKSLKIRKPDEGSLLDIMRGKK